MAAVRDTQVGVRGNMGEVRHTMDVVLDTMVGVQDRLGAVHDMVVGIPDNMDLNKRLRGQDTLDEFLNKIMNVEDTTDAVQNMMALNRRAVIQVQLIC